MPYVPELDRDLDKEPVNAGQLNYQITMLVKEYIELKGGNYQAFNDAMGALEGAKLELYRRKIAPYEDVKIGLNGDVY